MQGVAYERRHGQATSRGIVHEHGPTHEWMSDGIHKRWHKSNEEKPIDHNDGRTKHNGLKVRRINNDAVVAWGNEMSMMDAMR